VSRSVDLFIDTKLTIAEVAAKLGELLEHPLVANPDQTVFAYEHASVSLTLCAHEFIDDGDLLFSSYRYVLTGRVASTARVQDSAEAKLLRWVADKIQKEPRWPVLLVLDLQYRDKGKPPPH
jgi:hypothetical protein